MIRFFPNLYPIGTSSRQPGNLLGGEPGEAWGEMAETIIFEPQVELLVSRKLGLVSFASHLRRNGRKSRVKLEFCE
jgi:hypothetical protein